MGSSTKKGPERGPFYRPVTVSTARRLIGSLCKGRSESSTGMRDRIPETACHLLGRQGFQATGLRFALGVENAEHRKGARFGWRTRTGSHFASPMEIDL
jgi:hypothetical protein